jgi:uncharacterized protein YjdB
MMKELICWAMAAILVCGTSVFMSCSNDDDVTLLSIKLNKSTLSLIVGQTETLKATISPTNATDQAYTWSSDDTAIATVDANGKVTAVAVGTAVISATANNGSGVKGVCKVTVTTSSSSSTP